MQAKYLLLLFALTFSLRSHSFQIAQVTLSGSIQDRATRASMPYVNIVLSNEKDSAFVTGTISGEDGRFTLSNVRPGAYLVRLSYTGYKNLLQPVYVGSLSPYLDLGVILLDEDTQTLGEVVVTAEQDEVSSEMDKKTFDLSDNISQGGGSVLQAMQNLPGVTVQDGVLMLRGSDKVAVLVDGKQTALSGFGNQASLDNIPASAIEKIEVINNPSARYDANANAGIINIIFKKNEQEGFNGKVGFAAGAGALWVKRANLPTIRPQFQGTPKFNPSLSLNYRKKKLNTFLQSDLLYNPTLNKNEFVTRTSDAGEVTIWQTKRNRNTTLSTTRAGVDWSLNQRNLVTVSALYRHEDIIDNGDEPFFNQDLTERSRLWQFLEDEVKKTVTATSAWQHKFEQPGHSLNIGYNFTWYQEDEKYFFTNTLPTYTGEDSFAFLADEYVNDFTLDYVKPLRYGRVEGGAKYRYRNIPTNMEFFPGLNSPLDSAAGGRAEYIENIPALYGSYVFENARYELEAGLRVEYVDVQYNIDPNHNTYSSDGYNYSQPFPNVRLGYKLNDWNKLSLFFNRRVDRPNEIDIRVFPKYDDVELVKMGNPQLRPQFTNSVELGYKTNWEKGFLYAALYHRLATGTITRIASIVPGSTIIYNIMQNAGKSYNSGIEATLTQDVSELYDFNINLNGYRNQIDAFSVDNIYPQPNTFTSPTQKIISGNFKWNNFFHLPKQWELQLSAIYLAPDLIPQGKIDQRFTLDFGLKKQIQQGKGELLLNATDLLNTMVIRREIQGAGFTYVAEDYYETQVIRMGYSYKF